MHVATPVEVFTPTAPHPPIVIEFAVNATVPASGAGVTVAVIVTDCPNPDGLGDMANVVVVEARLTTCDSDVEFDTA